MHIVRIASTMFGIPFKDRSNSFLWQQNIQAKQFVQDEIQKQHKKTKPFWKKQQRQRH